MEYILLILGLVMIVKSADVLIDSTSRIARKYGVSAFVVGISVIAFGTSAPELAVGLISAVNKTNELALGNIIGSSVANIALIVGMASTIYPLTVKDTVIKREIPMLIGAQALLAFMVLYDGKLARWEGALLLLGFAGFILYVILDAKKSMKISFDSEGGLDTDGDGNNVPEPEKENSMLKLWLFSAASLAGLFIGGNLTVDNSTKIALNLGLSETLIGLTVVAIATTLPELMASIMAVRKKEPDIVLGNCVGSILFNILLVLGSSSAIHPIAAQGSLLWDMVIINVLAVALLVISLPKKKIPRLFGILLMTGYFGYIFFKVVTAL